MLTNDQVYQLVLNNQLIEEKILQQLKLEAEQQRVPLASYIIDKDVITDENLGKLIADNLKLPFVSMEQVAIPKDILAIVPELVARKQKVIAFAKDQTGIKVAMADPTNVELQQLLAKKTGEPILVYFTTVKNIESALKLYNQELQKTFDELMNEQLQKAHNAPITHRDAPISKIIDLLIQHSFRNKCSDVHIEPEKDSTLVRFRIDGVLHDVLRFPAEMHEQVISRIKVLGRLRTDEHMSAQDGKIHTLVDEHDLDIRVSIVPVVDGEKVVMRLLATDSRQLSLQDLGLGEKDLKKVQAGFDKPHGMVLSTGPTGSGKSTTIYSMIKMINTRDVNIATIEDPVEYDIDGINQIQVNSKTNLTFANGLRAILRQDPDVILVGEIRDEETASIAINSAMTGHLVFSTLHTNDAATTLPRLIDMSIEPFLVASTVNVIIGQRLVRKICEKCRFSLMKSADEIALQIPLPMIEKQFGKKKQLRLYEGKGCEVCHHTGYQGRIGIFEVLEVTEPIRKLIIQKAHADDITKEAVAEGMTTMMEDGLLKIERGLTTVEEILRATKA